MKLIRTLLFFSLLAITSIALQAQDIHYTLFNMSPLTLNPAQTGAFYGTARIGGIYRGQWYSVNDKAGFETPSIYLDAPIIRGFREKDWVGVGVVMVSDFAGDISLRTTSSRFSAAYHLGLGKEGTSVLTLGVQGGRVQRRFINGDPSRLRFGDSYQDGSFSINESRDQLAGADSDGEGAGVIMNNELMYTDFGAGLLFRSTPEDGNNLEIGLAVDHVTRPRELFVQGANNDNDAERRPLRILAHASYDLGMADNFVLAPTAMAQFQGGASAFNLQLWGKMLLNAEKQITVKPGLGYRFGDAVQILAGLDYKDLRVAAAYDINFSQLRNATNLQGAFEIGAWYIIKKYKQPNVKPAILCPRF